MKLLINPLFETLDSAQAILIAGAGGGFDVYAGLPLYFALREAGKDVHLANFSFAVLPLDSDLIGKVCVPVTADSSGSETYFPERTLSRWFRERHQEEVPVYAFTRCGVAPLRLAYERLRELLGLDAILLVDGGTDSLMRGDESGLGTPSEDIASIAAVNGVKVPTKLLSCIGFGVDFFHGVCHAQCFEAIAALTRSGGCLGTLSVLPQMPEAQEYLDAVAYAAEATPSRPSIVSASIASAVEGHFGNHQVLKRTAGSTLWINPLMPVYWSFSLSAIYDHNLYIRSLEGTQILSEVSDRIDEFRRTVKRRPWDEIPF
jgi:hypothetical protein